jgi:hypothetical protein
MELIQSFIAIPEAAAKQQAQKGNAASTVEAYQPAQSYELTAIVAVSLFGSPSHASLCQPSEDRTEQRQPS